MAETKEAKKSALYRFAPYELDGKYGRELAEYLQGKVATVSTCSSDRVRVERYCSPESPRELQHVACANPLCDCHHNLTGYCLEDVLNAWNAESEEDAEIYGPDYAAEIVVW